MFGALVITLSSTFGVAVTIEAGTPCLERAALEKRLTREGVSNASAVRLSPRAGGVRVELRKTPDATPDTRVVPTQGEDCRVVERVLVTLVVAWSKSLLAGPPIAKPMSPVTSEAPTSTPTPSRPEPAARTTPLREPPPRVATTPTARLQAEDAGVADGGSEPLFSVPPLVLASLDAGLELNVDAGRPIQSTKLTGELALLGGVALGPVSQPSAIGMVLGGAWFGRFGAAAWFSLESDIVTTRPEGTVRTGFMALALLGRVKFEPSTRLFIDLGVGVRGARIGVASTGFLNAVQTQLFGLGPTAEVGGTFRLLGPVALHASVGASLRLPSERLNVGGLGPVLELGPFQAQAMLGVLVLLGAP